MNYRPEYLFDPSDREWLLTISEAATRLRVSERTIYRMLREEQLTRVAIRGSTRILGSGVADLLDDTDSDPSDLRRPPSGDLLPIEGIVDEGETLDA